MSLFNKPGVRSDFFYTKRGGGKVKRFLDLVSFWRGGANFFLPVVVHRWTWSDIRKVKNTAYTPNNIDQKSPWDMAVLPLKERRKIKDQFGSVAQSSLTLCDPMNHRRQASLSITNSWSLPRLMSIESVMPSSHLILCRPLLLLPPIPPSIRVFSNESVLRIRWPKY